MAVTKRGAVISLARRQISEAEVRLEEAIKRHYPVNGPICWQLGGCHARVHAGHVVSHGYRDRIKVRNEKTGKERWISSFDFYEVA